MTKEELKSLIGQKELNKAIIDIIAYVVSNRKAVDAAIETANGKLTTLIGSDTGKSARTIANEELAAQLIPQSAKESLDTLQEIAAWIQDHPDDAAAMNQAITALQNLVGTLPAGTEATTVVGYITSEITRIEGLISGKNVSAEGDIYFGLTANNNKVTGAATQKTIDAIALAESAIQLSDLDTIGETAAANLVAAAITAAETPANAGE